MVRLIGNQCYRKGVCTHPPAEELVLKSFTNQCPLTNTKSTVYVVLLLPLTGFSVAGLPGVVSLVPEVLPTTTTVAVVTVNVLTVTDLMPIFSTVPFFTSPDTKEA